ncbi:MAG: hypothetical protein ACI4TI_00185 [Christensenellales bacterium]
MEKNLENKIDKKEKKIEKVQKVEEKQQERIEDFVNTIYQNLSTALKSIEEILKICDDDKLKAELNSEKQKYLELKNELLNVCLDISTKPKDNNIFEKAKLFTSIKMTTLADKSTRHLAEMMLIGTVMGTLTCYKDLCDYKSLNSALYALLNKLLGLEEENFNNLKKFLKEM